MILNRAAGYVPCCIVNHIECELLVLSIIIVIKRAQHAVIQAFVLRAPRLAAVHALVEPISGRSIHHLAVSGVNQYGFNLCTSIDSLVAKQPRLAGICTFPYLSHTILVGKHAMRLLLSE